MYAPPVYTLVVVFLFFLSFPCCADNLRRLQRIRSSPHRVFVQNIHQGALLRCVRAARPCMHASDGQFAHAPPPSSARAAAFHRLILHLPLFLRVLVVSCMFLLIFYHLWLGHRGCRGARHCCCHAARGCTPRCAARRRARRPLQLHGRILG